MKEEITLLNKAGVFALVCVGLLAISGVYFIFKSGHEADKKVFEVQGKGEVEVKATKATISADFVSKDKDQKVAGDGLAKISDKVFAALIEVGVKKEWIKTQNVSLTPDYEYCYSYGSAMPAWCNKSQNTNRVSGYTGTQNFTISVENDKVLVEKVLGLLPSLGVQNMNGPNWTVDNKVATQQAREKAVEEAKQKAEGIAKSLGMRLGEVQTYNENTGGGQPYPAMYSKNIDMRVSGATESSAPIQVSEGTDKVTVTVDITYELR